MTNRHGHPPASPWPNETEKERQRSIKREAVLSAAVRLFNLKGFHATSLDDVAAILGVTKPTIYHYFSNKDEILFECVNRGLTAISEATEVGNNLRGTGLERLKILLTDYAYCMMQDYGACVTRTSDNELSKESRARFRELKRLIDLKVRNVVSEGIADGSIAPGDPRLITFTITGALNWIARWYDPQGDMTRDDIAQGTVATLLTGLSPKTGP